MTRATWSNGLRSASRVTWETSIRNVDHELIAAGHPDLVFDFETYTAMLPPHWRTAPSDGVGGRAWTVGQVVALRESLKRLARRTQQRAATSLARICRVRVFCLPS